MTFTDVDPHAPSFQVRLPVAPGHVQLRDRLGWQTPQESQLGEEQLSSDLFSKRVTPGSATDSVLLLGETKGMVGYLFRGDTQSLGENAGRAPYLEVQATSEVAQKTGTKPTAEVEYVGEMFWNVNEGNVSESTSLSENAKQRRQVFKSDTEATMAAAIGVHGYGMFGYGQGGYGGTISLTG